MESKERERGGGEGANLVQAGDRSKAHVCHCAFVEGEYLAEVSGLSPLCVLLVACSPRWFQGAFDKATPCSTCALDMRECVGHFGHIELELPVFHIGYFKATLNVLQRICKVQAEKGERVCVCERVYGYEKEKERDRHTYIHTDRVCVSPSKSGMPMDVCGVFCWTVCFSASFLPVSFSSMSCTHSLRSSQ